MDFVVVIISASPVTDNGLKAGLGFKQDATLSVSRAQAGGRVAARTDPLRTNAVVLSPNSSIAAAASSGRDWLTRPLGSTWRPLG
jgi:hypothetical protein